MLLGVLSIIQVVFLPGYVAVEAARIRTGSWIESAVVVFGLSLLINYLFVFLLAALGAYTRASLVAVIGLEVVVLAILAVKRGNWRRTGGFELHVRVPRFDRWISAGVIGASVVALLVATAMSVWAIFRVNVFNAPDALFSWNYWAYRWTSGAVPKWTMVYPQLIPANWSVMYVLTANRELQLFPLSIMPLFGIAVLAMFVDLGLRRKRLEYFLALLLVLVWVFGRMIPGLNLVPYDSTFNGYVDMPLTFMAMAAFYLLELRDDRRPADWRELALPLILACAAAVTKMNGFYVVAVVLVAALIGHVARRPRLPAREWLKSGVLALSVLVIVPGTWYGMKVADFIAGRDTTHAASIAGAVDVAAGASGLAARVLHSALIVPGLWVTLHGLLPAGPWLTLGLTPLMLVLALLVPRARWVVVTIFVPYTLLWAAFLSYDTRNLLVMVPIVGYLSAFAIDGLCERFLHYDMRAEVHKMRFTVPRLVPVGIAVVALGCVVAFSAYFPVSTMTAISLQQQRMIGQPGVDAMLYAALAKGPPITGDLLTDYPTAMALPGLRSDPLRLDHSSALKVEYLDHGSITPQSLDGRSYLLISDMVPMATLDIVDSGLASGYYSLAAEKRIGQFSQWERPTTIRLIKVTGPAGARKP